MAKSLVIVESPSKAKTINKYLGKDFIVEATVGHIKNLPANELGVDVENGFEPKYVTIRGKNQVVKELQSRAAKVDTIYVATDPDREGEAIAQHIASEIARKAPTKPIFRVLFNEITKTGVREAMAHPRHIDEKMVQAQQARRVMDRIVGYKISPFLWKTIYKGLSAGRVQSVALHFICEREKEIQAFTVTEYWSVTGEFQKPDDGSFHAKLVKIGGKDPEIPNEAAAASLLEDIRARAFGITDVQVRDISRTPPAPFITSSLQQEASNRLRFSAKRTMLIAQQLYEGVELGEEGAAGLITYMRTDSTRISGEAVSAVRDHIRAAYGDRSVPAEPRVFKVKASAQDAHEAIRPTSMDYTPQRVRPFLTGEQYALYELVWKRFVASQMESAVMQQTSVTVDGGPYTFRGVGSVYTFRGFLQVYDDFDTEANGEKDEEESVIPENLAAGDRVDALSVDPHQHFTKPPPRYTESSLVRELEAKGIGRPSTYALIVSTVQERGYVEQKERRLYATTLGMDVNTLLQRHFQTLFSVEFTARMEEELDTVASGEASYLKVMGDFYEPFMTLLNSVSPEQARLTEDTDVVCEKCQRPMIIRWGRNGKFLACSGYPECKNAKPLPEDAEKMKIQEACPTCGKPLMLKQSRYGKFIGCSGYPDCTFTRPITTGIQCPKCKEGEISERMSKTKRTFFGCTKYPNCDFVSWDRPVAKPCPSCKNEYLSHKFTQKKGEFLKCPACKEEFTLDLEPFDMMQSAA
ncbi:MAG: type I DNA topoisomerase [Ignavibacteria bacterium]|nr:type I DNA topoisomerase [Ignavibacteria bacterium]